MSFFKHKPKFLAVLRESFLMIIGAVLIWRGIWVLLDRFDTYFFGGNHALSSIAGIIIGILLVFWADRDLDDVV